jgi:putative iron-regulated protein
MAKTIKLWTTLGVAVLAGAVSVQAGPEKNQPPRQDVNLILVSGEGGEGGEGGGEGAPATYGLTSTDANAFTYDAKPQVTAYTTLVHETYAASKIDAEKLAMAIDAMLENPTPETLATAQKSWISARPAYLRSETFRFYDGPIEAIEGEINAWPMNEAFIDYVEGNPNAGIVNGKSALDIAILIAANQKSDEADVTTGWHAIEFLLWGQDLSLDGPGKRPHTDYISGEGNNDRRRAYLQAVTAKLVTDLGALEAAWAPATTGNYRDTFEKLDQREALGRIVNGMAVLAGFEFMSERLGVALDSGDQEDEHSCFSDTTKQDFVQDLEGITRVWYNAKIGDLVASLDPETAKRISALLLDSELKIGKLGDPWDKVLASAKDSPERRDAEAAVASLQSLADGLKDVGGKLGVLVLIPSG